MLSSEFQDVFEKFPLIKKHYSGCFSSDTIPKYLKKNNFIICNTDISANEGVHWYAIVRKDNQIECFDSLGVTAEKSQFLQQNCKFKNINSLIYNTTWLVFESTSKFCH